MPCRRCFDYVLFILGWVDTLLNLNYYYLQKILFLEFGSLFIGIISGVVPALSASINPEQLDLANNNTSWMGINYLSFVFLVK